ncbi:FYVE/PHD zinc finger [Glarea lozoyensis ATCC 20868]|uniref:FYVE/PHD zinc finger n=1 Tax=Glarea lozoyensis (strain ATCC 20868 / MF5171) TaxID=1116229 RepID=S3CT55_GLAL2|nr:FYVE/PHD zinc finger [Glarea lozoyensis ATCC 20868]EPE28810.1 FYVE/PHD zinc finger [Glarea lozoyensis ATCC 20868]
MHSSLADQCITGAGVADSNMVPDRPTPDDIPGATDNLGAPEALPTPTTLPESPADSSENMADQCIVCLEDLNAVSEPNAHEVSNGKEAAVPISNTLSKQPAVFSNQLEIAVIKPCGHCLHDDCLREWTQKANSCPFCRQIFNLVEVLDRVGGTVLSEYEVENKKQVASTDFDPGWMEEAEEEEEVSICPICSGSDNEDVLLLCDACNAPYHTYCVGLSSVPSGQWFCMECQDDGTEARALEMRSLMPPTRGVRTQEGARRNRRRIREDHWVGAWSRFSNRVQDVMGIDLDFEDEEDSNMVTYRQLQRRTSSRAREFEQWQQRVNIATRQGGQGARRVFQAVAPPIRTRSPPTPVETREETLAWGAFDRSREMDGGAPRASRKRKSRSGRTSATASPIEGSSTAHREPERKLKRPRTRRVLEGEPSSSRQPSRPQTRPASRVSPNRPTSRNGDGPSFLTSLLREVERSDDDTSRPLFSGMSGSDGHRVTSPSIEHSSPAASPTSSTAHTPRALSTTPPPQLAKRHASPRPMTSHVDPVYPKPDYSPNRSPGEPSREMQRPISPSTEIRQPRPRRQKSRPLALARSPETSPARKTMSAEVKDGINRIVKYALTPHWKSGGLTKEQYVDINRDVSRKLYEIVADKDLSAEKEHWEMVATNEVAKAVQAVKLDKVATNEVANAVQAVRT